MHRGGAPDHFSVSPAEGSVAFALISSVTFDMGKRGLIGMVIVFAVGFILLGLTKCGYDKIESIREAEASVEDR